MLAHKHSPARASLLAYTKNKSKQGSGIYSCMIHLAPLDTSVWAFQGGLAHMQ